MVLNIQHPPVVIGGVGGSGTRLIAECLKQLGFFLGSDLNNANDNLWFTLLFMRPEILLLTQTEVQDLIWILTLGMLGTEQFTQQQVQRIEKLARRKHAHRSREWLEDRARLLIKENKIERDNVLWGWKAPNSHIILRHMIQAIPKVKYVHVMRNGLDMAYSRNQNQPRLWGEHFTGKPFKSTPEYSLKYWCAVHRRVLKESKPIDDNFLLLNYDKFCLEPEEGIKDLCHFLGIERDATSRADLLALVRPPSSIGRFQAHGTHMFDPADVAYVEDLGFAVR